MTIIAAVSKEWGIGNGNRLLFSIPSDMKFFRETTSGSVVIMGRKTLESFPGKRPLKNRVNIVLTRDGSYETEAVVCTTKESVLEEIKKYPDKEVFVIGGESIYRLFEGDCDTAFITKVNAEAAADKFLGNFDQKPDWRLAEKSGSVMDNGYEITFCKYERI